MFWASKSQFALSPHDTGAAKRVLKLGGGSKAVALPPHFQDWEQLMRDTDPRAGADLVCTARALRERAGANSSDALHCSRRSDCVNPNRLRQSTGCRQPAARAA